MEEWHGDAGVFHSLDLPAEPRVWVVIPDRPALVLGSSQSVSEIAASEAERLGLQVVIRRSGGGAVWLDPRRSVWIDVTVPRSDPLWVDDVPRSAVPLGRALAVALGADTAFEVYEGEFVRSPITRALCFAGLAPGELTVGGHKAVGISQRRTREVARFQCVAYTEWDPGAFADAFVDAEVASSVRSLEVAEVQGTATGIGARLARFLGS